MNFFKRLLVSLFVPLFLFTTIAQGATVTFALRGDSVTPRYNLGDPRGFTTVSNTITSSANADSDNLSGGLIDCTNGSSNKGLIYQGKSNTPNNRSQSYLIRIKMPYTGAPAANRILFTLTAGNAGAGPFIQFYHAVTSGNVIVVARNQVNNSAVFNSTSFGAWTTNTTGSYYDFFWVFDGTTTANAGKLYIDNTLLGQATAGNAFESTWYSEYFGNIILCGGPNVAVSNISIDEFVVWDGANDPANTALVSGTGALDGAARTSLVDVSAFDGSVNTGTAAGNILSGSSIVIAGTTTNGTYVTTATGDVKTGVTFGAASALTGTYTGSDRWTDPGVANTLLGVTYKADSTTNNRTGTVRLPTVDLVEDGYLYGASDALEGTLLGVDFSPVMAELRKIKQLIIAK